MNTNHFPLISIIIPVYNVDEFLSQCLISICNQTYSNIEIILINDGSTDSSYSICTQYSLTDSRIILIDQENIGVSSTRNKGLNIASGEYIAFIDSDDYIAPSYIENLYNSIINNNVDISICGYTRVQLGKDNIERILNDTSYLSREDLFRYVLCNNNIGGYLWNKLFIKSIISDYGLRFNPNLSIGEDMVFITQYLLHCQSGVYSPITLYYYRLNNSSALKSMHTTHTFDKHKTSNLEASNLIAILVNSEGEQIRSFASYRQVRTSMWLIFNMIVCNYYDKTLLLKIKKILRKNVRFYLFNENAKLLEKLCALLLSISPACFTKIASLLYKSPLKRLTSKYLN